MERWADLKIMTIAIITKSIHEHAGIGRVGLNVASEFSNAGHQVKVVSEGGDYKGDHLKVDFTRKNPFAVLGNIYRIALHIKDVEFVIAYDLKPAGIYTYLASLLSNKKYILHCIGTYSLCTAQDSKLKRWLMKQVFKNASRVFFLSTLVRSAVSSSIDLPENMETLIVPPGVMTQTFYKVTEKPRSLPASVTSYIITVGAVKSRKGHDLSIGAFSALADEFPDLHYVIVGDMADNGYCQKIIKQVAASGLNDRVHFLQGVDDQELRRLYSNALLHVMTPRTTEKYIEGFGIVYLEAALCGLTSVGTKGTGAEDAILDGETGRLCEPELNGITLAVEEILHNKEFKQSLEYAAEVRAKRFDWGLIINQYKII